MDWPFEEPRNLATITARDVAEGRVPILFVAHDVDDGGWQFLGEEVPDAEQLCVVGLDCISELDPTIGALADLPLGFEAHRENPGAPWVRSSAVPVAWDDLVREAHSFVGAAQQRLEDEFRAGEWERFHYDQETASFTWLANDVPRVRARARVAGSLSEKSGTWLWSWANTSVVDGAREFIHLVQVFGEQRGFEPLAEPQRNADEVDAWEATVVACFLLQGEGVYRAPLAEGLYTFLILDEVAWVE